MMYITRFYKITANFSSTVVLLSFLFMQIEAYSQTDKNSTPIIVNNSVLVEDDIRQTLQVKIRDSIVVTLARNLQDQGYFKPIIFFLDSVTLQADTIPILTIKGGNPFTISRVIGNFKNGGAENKVVQLLDGLQGLAYSSALVYESCRDILSYYEETGYPFAAVKFTQVEVGDSTDEVLVYIELDRQQFCSIDGILATGNKETKEYVISRQAGIQPGAPYQQSEVQRVKNRVMRLRLFSAVGDPQYVLGKDGKGRLIVPVQEKNNNTFDGVVGYMPGNNEKESGYFTGMVNVQMRNIMGTARGISIRWQKLERAGSELELQYLEPWLAGIPLSVLGKYFQKQQDSSYVIRNIEGTFDYSLNSDFSIGFETGYQMVIPSLREVPVFTVYRSSSLFTGFRFQYDNRDDPLLPRQGMFIQNSYRLQSKEILGPPEYVTEATIRQSELQRFSFDGMYFINPFGGQVFAISLHARELRGNMLESSDMFRLGGTNTLRGYRENQFTAPRIAWSNVEVRSFLARRSYAFLFFDTGYFYQKEDSRTKLSAAEEIKLGYGAGLVLESGLGLMNVSFALAKGDAFSQGKIHFGLLNEF